jgi:hypothetical protein
MKPTKDKILPVRLNPEQYKVLADYRATTGLTNSFIIRRCLAFALPKFANGGANILNLTDKQ